MRPINNISGSRRAGLRGLAWRLTRVLTLAAVVPCGFAHAQLAPQEVVVVANRNAEGSVALGKYYCLARDIMPDRMIVLETAAASIVSREEYETSIRRPIREFLVRNGLENKTRCLALMWGVPVRVLGNEPPPASRELVKSYRQCQDRLVIRMAGDLQMLRSVNLISPPARTDALRPVGALFDPRTTTQPGQPDEFFKLQSAVSAEFQKKQLGVANLDAARRAVSLRQLAALRLEIYGIDDLLANLPAATPGVPSVEALRAERQELEVRRAALALQPETPALARDLMDVIVHLRGVIGAHAWCQERLDVVDSSDEDASVDSELSVLYEDGLPLRRWLPNALNWRLAAWKDLEDSPDLPADNDREAAATSAPATGAASTSARAAATSSAPAGRLTTTRFVGNQQLPMPKRMIMAARIDGPLAKDALRIIKDSIATEKEGLKGTFYIDAGGKYPSYDPHLTKLAEFVQKQTKIPVVLDTKPALFAPGTCPDAALYVGWYSVRQYVPAFTWNRGAVAWHIASYEAHHLRTPAAEEWCVKMIQNGVAATLGAVNEPYLGAFPPPEEFFLLLLTGRFSVAECYWRTVPATSWRLTLIADPLYNPFKLDRKVSVFSLPEALRGKIEP